MTANQLTYHANIENARHNRAQEELKREEIAETHRGNTIKMVSAIVPKMTKKL